jgi:hypothetical protein
MTDQEAIDCLDEAEHDFYIKLEYLTAIRMGKEALIEREERNAGNNNSYQ